MPSVVKMSYDASSVCTTPVCVQAAQAILTYMSPNYTQIDPCTDWNTCKNQLLIDSVKNR